MLDGNPPISSREHRWFFAATLSGLIIRLVPIAIEICFPTPPDPKISFGIYSIFDMWDMMSPVYSLATFIICVPLAWKLRPGALAFSLFPLGLLTYFFDYWFIDSQLRRHAFGLPFEFDPTDYVLLGGNLIDVLTFALVNVLIVWQVGIMYRIARLHK